MDYLQYIKQATKINGFIGGVLNLVINGLPSIHNKELVILQMLTEF